LRLGLHVFTSGGLIQAARRAAELGCETIQIWSGNPRGWRRSPLDPGEAARFKEMLAEAGIHPLFVHLPYLANMATEDALLWGRSRDLLVHALERADALGAAIVAHVGSSNAPSERAEERVAGAASFALERAVGSLILENMAGQGAQVGHDLAQLVRMLARVGEPGRTGVCLDTAHAFAAGYDIATRAGIDEVLAVLGPERLKLIHLNDSKAARGSRIDRHANIGRGMIGEAGMRALLTHPALAETPAVMETPKDPPGSDERNMAAARRLSAPLG
jgi:deoxyribonuclease-4